MQVPLQEAETEGATVPMEQGYLRGAGRALCPNHTAERVSASANGIISLFQHGDSESPRAVPASLHLREKRVHPGWTQGKEKRAGQGQG